VGIKPWPIVEKAKRDEHLFVLPIFETCMSHLRLFEIVTPRSLACFSSISDEIGSRKMGIVKYKKKFLTPSLFTVDKQIKFIIYI